MGSAAKQSMDTYSPVEASRVLGVSEKRVRQLADAGRLAVVSRGPLRLGQRSVVELRDARKAQGRRTTSTATRRTSPVDVEAVVTRTVEVLVPKMLETAAAAAARVEDGLREQLHAERARAEAAEAELRALRASLAGRRRLLRRAAAVGAPAAR